MNQNTQKIINDLKAAGLDMSSVETQIQRSPLLDRQADSIIGGGILRQQEYSRYMNDLKTKEQSLQNQVNQLASLHDARDTGVSLSQEQLNAIKQMEDLLIATGEFDEASIRNVSRVASSPVKVPANTNINSNPNINPNIPNPTVSQPDLSNYVDASTFRNELANIAYGGISTNMMINAYLDEVKSLGIKVGKAEVLKLQDNLRNGYEKGKGLDDIFEETFEVSKARQAKNQAEIDNQIKLKVDQQVAERLKEAGVPTTKKFNFGRRHPVFDRKSATQRNTQSPEANIPSNEEDTKAPPVIDPNAGDKLPVNKYGDTEIFRGRRSREDRMQAASGVLEQVMEHYANDPTYVD